MAVKKAGKAVITGLCLMSVKHRPVMRWVECRLVSRSQTTSPQGCVSAGEWSTIVADKKTLQVRDEMRLFKKINTHSIITPGGKQYKAPELLVLH